MAINAKNITIRNCDFSYIGGAVWQRNRKIRFGNGAEFWNYAENILIENCTFDKADFGSAIYSIIPPLEKGQFLLKNNTFKEVYPELIKWENKYISLDKFNTLF